MSSDEKTVFHCIANCEVYSYTHTHAPDKVAVSTGEIAKMCLWTKYRVRKAIKWLVEKGYIEKVSVGRPAVVMYGEYEELLCEAMPPKNGYVISEQGFRTEEWKNIYDLWCRSMEEWLDDMV